MHHDSDCLVGGAGVRPLKTGQSPSLPYMYIRIHTYIVSRHVCLGPVDVVDWVDQ